MKYFIGIGKCIWIPKPIKTTGFYQANSQKLSIIITMNNKAYTFNELSVADIFLLLYAYQMKNNSYRECVPHYRHVRWKFIIIFKSITSFEGSFAFAL